MNWNLVPWVKEFVASIDENQGYLRKLEPKAEKWIAKFAIGTRMNLEKLNSYIVVEDENGSTHRCHLAPVLGASGYGLMLVDATGVRVYNSGWKVSLCCQHCGLTRRVFSERKLFYKRWHTLCRSCARKAVDDFTDSRRNYCDSMMKRYGTTVPIRNPVIKAKTQQTMRSRYGAESPLESPIIQRKIAETMLRKFGVTNIFDCPHGQELASDGFAVKYGSANRWKTIIGDKIIATTQYHFGVKYALQSEDIRRKIRATCFDRYGVETPFQSPEFLTQIRTSGQPSKISLQFFHDLAQQLKFPIQYGDSEKVFVLHNRTVFADGYVECKKLVIEFYGDYWHANPRYFIATDIIKRDLVIEVWEHDAQRITDIKAEFGVSVMIVWESDYKNGGNSFVAKIAEEINQC